MEIGCLKQHTLSPQLAFGDFIEGDENIHLFRQKAVLSEFALSSVTYLTGCSSVVVSGLLCDHGVSEAK